MGTYDTRKTRTAETKLDRGHKLVRVKCRVSLTCEVPESRMVNLRVAQQNAREEANGLPINDFVIVFTLHDKISQISGRCVVFVVTIAVNENDFSATLLGYLSKYAPLIECASCAAASPSYVSGSLGRRRRAAWKHLAVRG